MADIYLTTDTPLAAYLIQSGFALVEILYEPKPNSNRQQATFAFSYTAKLQSCITLYENGTATVNLILHERAKSNLLDRIMRGLQ